MPLAPKADAHRVCEKGGAVGDDDSLIGECCLEPCPLANAVHTHTKKTRVIEGLQYATSSSVTGTRRQARTEGGLWRHRQAHSIYPDGRLDSGGCRKAVPGDAVC